MNPCQLTSSNLNPTNDNRGIFSVHRPAIPTAPQPQNFKPNNTNPKPAEPIPNQQNKPAENPPETHSNPAQNSRQPTENSTENPRPPHGPKRGPVGFLFTLPLETQHEILEMLEHHPRRTVSRHLALPEPDGLGVQVSEDCLKRFLTHHKLRREQERHAQLASEAHELLAASRSDSEQELTRAALHLIKTQLLEHTIQDNTLEQLSKLHLILNRIRLTDLAERRLSLQQKQTPSQ